MRRSIAALSAACALLSLAAAAAPELPSLPPARCVLDQAGAIDRGSLQELEDACVAFDKSGAGQLAVVTVRDYGEMDGREFRTELFKKLKLGHKGRDDGILVVYKPGTVGHRDLRVEVGYGLEGALNDGKVGALIDQEAKPFILAGNTGAALLALGNALIAEAQKENGQGVVERRAKEKKAQDEALSNAFSVGGAIFLAFAIWLVLLLSFRISKHVPGPLSRLASFGSAGAAALGALIGGGPFRLNLLIFVVVISGITALAYWGVARHKCPKCGKWLDITSRTLRAATYTHAGVEEVTELCSSCGYSRVYQKEIPRKQISSSTGGYSGGGGGGGGGGGFSGGGGGSSGGGGADRSF